MLHTRAPRGILQSNISIQTKCCGNWSTKSASRLRDPDGGAVRETKELEISKKDTMYEGDREHYIAVGQSALHCLKTAMMAVEKSNVRKVLDFGCGFGRVLRVLKHSFPGAEFTACDISREAIDFCAHSFGANPVLSSEEPHEIQLKDKFDLIWCGTLLTQFDAPQFSQFLEFFRSLLLRDGLLVFTTHGPFVAERLRAREGHYGLDDKSISTILSGYDRKGFGYADYSRDIVLQVGVKKYGVCVSRPSWVCQQIESLTNMRLVAYTERAWDNHQDSVACTNR
jgi:SAM-dependent methyltransferase